MPWWIVFILFFVLLFSGKFFENQAWFNYENWFTYVGLFICAIQIPKLIRFLRNPKDIEEYKKYWWEYKK
ncbi:MAG: hypothetical protein JM58_09435 [Peptococcaceae bacterium BICA1-8]|nr:MAG: hypothetical protein JM58_09435 [Peptococcaceae bacterium BICA1-8]